MRLGDSAVMTRGIPPAMPISLLFKAAKPPVCAASSPDSCARTLSAPPNPALVAW
jgi:hypothetical protein